MNLWVVLGEAAYVILVLFLLIFTLYNWAEKEWRAYRRSLVLVFFFLSLNILILFFLPIPRNWSLGFFFISILGLFLYLFFSPSPKKTLEIVGSQKRIDERDIIFARFDYEVGSQVYLDYYARRPELKNIDDEIRSIPDLLTPPKMKKNPALFSLAAAEFAFLEHQLNKVDGKRSDTIVAASTSENTRLIKGIVEYLGSGLSGICKLNPAYVYSHVGRGIESIGEEIFLDHEYAIAFAVEMDLEWVASAPEAPVIVETAKKYVEAAKISIILADLIRRLGYSARAHIAGSNYQAVLPPIAWEAGLGELGRLGTLITWKYGPRARLGLVTTDLPLSVDKPKTMGVQNFCDICQKCAQNCPAHAIPDEGKVEENGVLKWVLNREECYRFWRKAGTDCAMCIYVCPYSKADNMFHHAVRKFVSMSSAGQSLSLLGDNFFYGKKPMRRRAPI
jgi:reductive dehalogenase